MWKQLIAFASAIYSKEGFTVALLCVVTTILWMEIQTLKDDVYLAQQKIHDCYEVKLEHMFTQNEKMIKVLNQNKTVLERVERKLDRYN